MIVIIWTVSQKSVRKMETDVNSGCLKWQSELTVQMFCCLFFLCGKMCWTVESKNFQYVGKHKELPVLPSNSNYSSPEANTFKKSCHRAAIFKCPLHLFGQLYWRIIYIIFCGHTDINTACNQQLTWFKKKLKLFPPVVIKCLSSSLLGFKLSYKFVLSDMTMLKSCICQIKNR